MANKFADTIYETPDNWGETTVADRKRMEETVEQLKTLGDDWEDVSIDDCTDYKLIRVLDNGTALYEGDWHSYGDGRSTGRYNGVVFSRESEMGFYKRIETYDSIDEFERDNA